jgi:hypothetical protein
MRIRRIQCAAHSRKVIDEKWKALRQPGPARSTNRTFRSLLLILQSSTSSTAPMLVLHRVWGALSGRYRKNSRENIPTKASVLTIRTTNTGRPRRAPRASTAVFTVRPSYSSMKRSMKFRGGSTCARIIGSFGGAPRPTISNSRPGLATTGGVLSSSREAHSGGQAPRRAGK